MLQTVHFNLDVIELTSSAEVGVLSPIGFKELVSQDSNLLFCSEGSFLLHLGSIISSVSVALRTIYHLLVMRSLLCSLKFKSTALLLKVSLDPVTLIAESLRVPVLCLLAIVLLLLLETLTLLTHALLHFFFHGFFTSYGFLLHSSLHLFQFQIQIFLLRH